MQFKPVLSCMEVLIFKPIQPINHFVFLHEPRPTTRALMSLAMLSNFASGWLGAFWITTEI